MKMTDWDTEEEIDIPSHKVVCPRCGGEGVHDHPAFSNGFSREDFEEDPDFAEEYMAGRYDVTCEVCHGANVVDEPDLERCNDVQKRVVEAHWEAEREKAWERRMRERGIEY